jgi:hypothetical protein
MFLFIKKSTRHARAVDVFTTTKICGGNAIIYKYRQKQIKHGGPTFISFRENGGILCLVYNNGIKPTYRHRVNGPAEVTFYKNGEIWYELWKYHGVYHRLDGPAIKNFGDRAFFGQTPIYISTGVWYRHGIFIKNELL